MARLQKGKKILQGKTLRHWIFMGLFSFGSIEEFSGSFTAILSSLLFWKAQNGFLFRADELLKGA